MYICVYIYIYQYSILCCITFHYSRVYFPEFVRLSGGLRPTLLLTLRRLTLLESNFPGKSPVDMRSPPLGIKLTLESNPPKSTVSAGEPGV